MLRTAQLGSLTFDSANRLCLSIRQPGEDCNLRMGDSVGCENLLALRVVSEANVSQSRGRYAVGSAANDANGFNVSFGSARVNRHAMVPKVRNEHLIILLVDENAARVIELRLRPFQYADRN